MIENYKDIEAKMFHFEKWIANTDNKFLKIEFEDLLLKSGFTTVNFVEYYFPVKGYTCVWVLAESHLAIHTFPSRDQTYIQISSCNKAKLNTFKSLLSSKFSEV